MIAIIADLHDNLKNFERFLHRIDGQDISHLWVAGDLGTPDTLQTLINSVSAPIFFVAGNVEEGHGLKNYAVVAGESSHCTFAPQAPLVFRHDGNIVHMYHQIPSGAHATQSADIVVSGHTHRPTLSHSAGVWHVNPGTLGGVFLPPTYALYDPIVNKFYLNRLYQQV